VLNVLGRLVALEPAQADLLERICAGPTILAEDLKVAMASAPAMSTHRKSAGQGNKKQGDLLG